MSDRSSKIVPQTSTERSVTRFCASSSPCDDVGVSSVGLGEQPGLKNAAQRGKTAPGFGTREERAVVLLGRTPLMPFTWYVLIRFLVTVFPCHAQAIGRLLLLWGEGLHRSALAVTWAL